MLSRLLGHIDWAGPLTAPCSLADLMARHLASFPRCLP